MSTKILVSECSCLAGNGNSCVFWVVNCVQETKEYGKRPLTRLFTWTSSRDLAWLYRNSVFRKWVVFPSWSEKSMNKLLNIRREEKPTRCHWMVYCTYSMLNMFRALLCPLSGARDYMCVINAYSVQCFVAGCRGSDAGQQTMPAALHLTSDN